MVTPQAPQDNGSDGNPPPSLLPYQEWIESAYRQVALNALSYAMKEGLPGNHHFYLTFLTQYPKVEIPDRLRAQYPNEVTIVLQHQFWDLNVDSTKQRISVGLSFGGVGSILVIPFGALIAFSDPEAQIALTFQSLPPSVPLTTIKNVTELRKEDTSSEESPSTPLTPPQESQVISLDLLRKKRDSTE